MSAADRTGGSGVERRRTAGNLPEGASAPWHRLGQGIAATVVRWPYRLRIHHADRIPASGPVVLVANHSSLVDGPLLFGMLRREAVFLVKHELFRGPLGWFLRRIGQIPVRRGEPDRAPLMAAMRVLRAGGLVAVFPEGTRDQQGEVSTAQHGAAWLARSTGASVLPVACRGTRRPEWRRRRLLPRVDVLFGEPVRLPEAKGRAGLLAATEQVRAQLVDLLGELDRIGAAESADHDDDAKGNQA